MATLQDEIEILKELKQKVLENAKLKRLLQGTLEYYQGLRDVSEPGSEHRITAEANITQAERKLEKHNIVLLKIQDQMRNQKELVDDVAEAETTIW